MKSEVLDLKRKFVVENDIFVSSKAVFILLWFEANFASRKLQ